MNSPNEAGPSLPPNPLNGQARRASSVSGLRVRQLSGVLACVALALSVAGCAGGATHAGARAGEGPAPVAAAPEVPPKLDTIQPFWGHRNPVEHLEFSADGHLLFTVSPGEEVIAWSPHDGTARRKYRAPFGDPITGFLVDPEGAWLAVGDAEQVWFWDVATGEQTRRLALPPSELPGENKAKITAVALAGNPDFMLIGDDLGRLLVVDIDSGEAAKIYRTDLRGIHSLSGNAWAVMSDRQHTLAIDLKADPVPLPVMGKLEGLAVRDLHRSFDGKAEVAVGTDGVNLIKWGPDFAKPARAIKDAGGIGIDVDRQAKVAVAADGSDVKMTAIEDNKRLEIVMELPVDPVRVAIDPNGMYVASAELNQVVIRRMKKSNDGPPGHVAQRLNNARVPRFLKFEPGTHRFLVAGNDGRPTRYDLDKPQVLEPFLNVSSPIVDGALDLDTNGYYATTSDGSIIVFDYAAGKIARDLDVDIGPKPHIALSKSRMAVVSELRGLRPDEERRGELVIYDLLENTILESLNVTDAIDVEFAPAGPKVFYAGRSAVIEAWNYENNQRKKIFDDLNSTAARLRMSPGGVQLALCGDQGVAFYNSALEMMSGAAIPNAVDIAFAFDGTRAAVATHDRGVYLVRFEGDDAVRTEPVVHTPTPVTALAVSSDNKYLLVGEARGTVTVVDLASRSVRPLVTLQIFDDENWAAYTPSGSYVGNPGEKIRFDIDGEISRTIGSPFAWKRDADAVIGALSK